MDVRPSACHGFAQELVQELLGPFFFWLFKNIFSGPFFDNDAIRHKDHMTCHAFCKAHFVGHDNHRRSFIGKGLHDAEHVADKFRVKGRRWFIKKDHIGPHRNGPGNTDALLLTARKLGRIGVRPFQHTHLLQGFPRPLFRFRLADAAACC